MSTSASQSKSETTNYNEQKTAATYGAAGQRSPTINTEGNVTFTDSGGEVSQDAVKAMRDVVSEALSQQNKLNLESLNTLSGFVDSQARSQSQQSGSSAALLSDVLKANQTLAENVQTGGGATNNTTTRYYILGAVVLAIVAAVAWIWKKG